MDIEKKEASDRHMAERLALNVAIVGGGRACKSFLAFLKDKPSSFLDIKVVGVCDTDPNAEGLLMAEDMGIYTTDNFHDFFRIKELNALVELTNSRDTLVELTRLKPEKVGILDHNVGRLLTGLSTIDQILRTAQQTAVLEKAASDFFIQQANSRIVVLNPDYSIVEANESYLKAVGKSKKDVIGAHCYEITHGLGAPCSSLQPDLGCPMAETLKTGESAHVIHEHPTRGSIPTYCDMLTYPLKDGKGEIIQIIEIWRDITEEISSRWERRVNAMKADLRKVVQEDRMISLGKLVASSVHEINNPIQGLLTFSHLMEQILDEGKPGPDDLARFKDYLSLMSGELERCGNIISGLLSFSRQSKAEFKNLDINEILDQVVTLTRHKMEIDDIQLSMELSSGPLVVNGSVNQFQQCFLNLVFNAIEAMSRGGRLTVVSKRDSSLKSAIVQVQDTGCGIPEEYLDNIFDPFFTTKEEGEGTGLGLSIVHGVVKAHKGSIEVDSQVGKGTAFTLTFPVA